MSSIGQASPISFKMERFQEVNLSTNEIVLNNRREGSEGSQDTDCKKLGWDALSYN